MSSHKLPNIPSLRRHQLFLEFASLKHAPPPGVYVSINSPGDPTFWTGVLFVRSGPYAGAILRFHIRFPPSYPDLPPLVTFTTDIFHPLIVPLTTYTFTTGSSNEDPVSATDEERLPPGGFSLRHGFPHWFGRAQRTAANSAASSRRVSGSDSGEAGGDSAETSSKPAGDGDNAGDNPQSDPAAPSTPEKKADDDANATSPSQASNTQKDTPSRVSPAPTAAPYQETQKTVSVVTLLNYIRSTFDDENILDSLPLDAAGNPGAWHAWRAHRRSVKGVKRESKGADASTPDSSVKKGTPQARLPGEWNWEGVWANRVQSCIEASQSDAMLFGNARGGDDSIRFLDLDEASLASVKEKIIPPTEKVQE
ncbi:hypothetical protein VTN77DRAFT_9430 [Rasamsonia byssochlamydoides]|uniref:uncharacterized protein n=1 Tax=Rasamsonia byssochlamydoides TaxID=89139 RepID=UPI003743D11A